MSPLPSLDDLHENKSVILVNTHRSLCKTFQTVDAEIVHIGGAHLKKPKALPKDFKAFLDESTEGAIYFSFDTVINPTKMPKEQLNVFLGESQYLLILNIDIKKPGKFIFQTHLDN